MKKVSGSSPTLKLFQTQPLLVDLRQSFFHFLMESGVTVSQEIPSAVRDDSLKEAYWRIDVLHRHLILWTVTGLEVLNANESLVSVETSPQDWKCGSVISFWCCFEILSYSYPHYIKLSSWPCKICPLSLVITLWVILIYLSSRAILPHIRSYWTVNHMRNINSPSSTAQHLTSHSLDNAPWIANSYGKLNIWDGDFWNVECGLRSSLDAVVFANTGRIDRKSVV